MKVNRWWMQNKSELRFRFFYIYVLKRVRVPVKVCAKKSIVMKVRLQYMATDAYHILVHFFCTTYIVSLRLDEGRALRSKLLRVLSLFDAVVSNLANHITLKKITKVKLAWTCTVCVQVPLLSLQYLTMRQKAVILEAAIVMQTTHGVTKRGSAAWTVQKERNILEAPENEPITLSILKAP